MKTFLFKLLMILIAFSCFSGLVKSAEPPVWPSKVVARFHADEAIQGVATDEHFFYAVADQEIGKYQKTDGKKVAAWKAEPESGIIHLNSGNIADGLLYSANSNWPAVPPQSSIEIWDTKNLKHTASHSYGVLVTGTLTWLDVQQGQWFACFCNYDKKGSAPNYDSNWSFVARLNEERLPVESWMFPKELTAKFDGYGASGGSFGPGNRLYVSGHMAGEIYVLEFPKAGSVLRWIATIEAPFRGQAMVWDRYDKVFYTIDRNAKEVIVVKVDDKYFTSDSAVNKLKR